MINGSEFLREIDDDAHKFFHLVQEEWHGKRAAFARLARQVGEHILDQLPRNLPETREALAHLAAFASAAVAAVDAAEQAAQTDQEAPVMPEAPPGTRLVRASADARPDGTIVSEDGWHLVPDDPAELDPEAARVADALSPSGLIPAQ